MTGQRLHPEGAPGEHDKWMRTLLGDTRYETVLEREQEDREWVRSVRSSATERQTAIVTILRLAAAILLLLFLLGLAVSPAIVSWLWKAFL